MATRIVLSADHEVIPELDLMELDRDKLIDVCRIASSERALCTKNDVSGFGLITMQAKMVRGLRDLFCGERWERDETDNQSGIKNPFLKLRVIACNFNHNAAHPVNDPTNLVRKGNATDKKARCNATPWLPWLPDIPTQEGADVTTWVLASYTEDDSDILKAELSLPVTFVGNQYKRFEKRIILLKGDDGGGPKTISIVPDRNEPTDIIDISINRK
jgi:hypothetical protein